MRLHLHDPAIIALISDDAIAYIALVEPIATKAPATDLGAHLCDHPRNAPGDTQGCPRWPVCLAPGPRA